MLELSLDLVELLHKIHTEHTEQLTTEAEKLTEEGRDILRLVRKDFASMSMAERVTTTKLVTQNYAKLA